MSFADFSDQVLENWSFWTIEGRRDFCCRSKQSHISKVLVQRVQSFGIGYERNRGLCCAIVCVYYAFSSPFFAECGEMVTQFLGLLQYKHHFRRI